MHFARSTRTLFGLMVLAVASVSIASESKRGSSTHSAASAMRNWTDVTGKFKVKARLLEVVDGKARLEKSDGKVVTVPVEKLCEADQKWLERHPPAEKSEQSGAADWPCFGGANHDNKSPDTGLLKQWPDDGPPLVWKAEGIGEGYAGVSVAGGVVYVTGESDNVLRIHAFDSEGKPVWKTEHGPAWTANYPGSRATPTIDGNRLYLLSGVGLLGCFDVKTGKRQWVRDAKEFGGSPGGWGYAESPLVLGKLVIFKPGGQNCIVALDKATGRDVWASRGIKAGPEYGSCLPVELGGRTMVVTGTTEGIVSVDARSGEFLWGNPFSAHNTANCPTPVFADGRIFWSNGYGKGGICLKLAGGKAEEAWKTHEMVCHHGGYVIHEGHIYGNHNGGWTCLELSSGRKLWENNGEVGKGSLCYADGMLYLFGENGGRVALAACSPDGLEIRGKMQVQGNRESWAHPVVIGGRLYIRYDTNLYCFDVKAK